MISSDDEEEMYLDPLCQSQVGRIRSGILVDWWILDS